MEQTMINQSLLENEKVKLIPISLEHLNELAIFGLEEPYLWKYTLDQPTSKEKMKVYIEKAIEEKDKNSSFTYVVYDCINAEIAGSTRLYELDFVNKTCSVGYTWFGKKFQGTGINKNSKYLLFQYAFEVLDMQRMQFRADAANQKSINAIKSLGCTEEGILRSNLLKSDGTRRDSIILSILRSEWDNFAKENLKNKL